MIELELTRAPGERRLYALDAQTGTFETDVPATAASTTAAVG